MTFKSKNDGPLLRIEYLITYFILFIYSFNFTHQMQFTQYQNVHRLQDEQTGIDSVSEQRYNSPCSKPLGDTMQQTVR